MKNYFLIFLLFHSSLLLAQNQATLDSLLLVTESNISDQDKVDTYVKLAEEYRSSDSTKTYHYAQQAIQLAKKIKYPEGKIDALYLMGFLNLSKKNYQETKAIFQQIIQESEKCQYLKGKANGFNGLGYHYYNLFSYDQALDNFFKSLEVSKASKDHKLIVRSYISIGEVYYFQYEYDQALDNFFKSLEVSKASKDHKLIVRNYNNIGEVYYFQHKYDQALDNFLKALYLNKKIKDKRGITKSYVNIGKTYAYQKSYKKALEYYSTALKTSGEANNEALIADIYYYIGEINCVQQNYNEALKSFAKALNLYQRLADKNSVSLIYNYLGNIYRSLGNFEKALEYNFMALEIVENSSDKSIACWSLIGLGKTYKDLKQWRLAQTYLKKGFQIAEEIQTLEGIKEAVAGLSQVEKELGNYQAAYEYQVLFKEMADSLFNEEQTKKFTTLELSYEFEQEKDSIQLANQTKQALLEKDIENRHNIQIATLIGLGLSLALVITLIFFFRNQKINNQKLHEANEEVKSVNETLHLTLNTVQHQRDQILASINYAQRIQNAILPLHATFDALLPHHFIFFKPRDIVSGDFYYIREVHNKIILAAVDCTGHGVPGAFVSLIGYLSLNVLTVIEKMASASEILGQMHIGIRRILRQKETKTYDGMDMALVSIDLENRKMEFAGAKNPLIYIQNGELHQIKGDIFGIGGEQRDMERNYTFHEIDISEPTTFYLFSDGYQDQFGGPKKRKFMTKRFRELLLEIHTKPMAEQQAILDRTLQHWMQEGNQKQTDDILVLGVRV